MKLYFFLIICTILFMCSSLWLQVASQNYLPATIEHITVSDGLPQNTVQCIEKDYFGFMWFGTDNGLCRYDGYDFDYYEKSNSADTLWNDRILNVVSGANHFLWITTSTGLHLFNTLTGKFEILKNKDLSDLFALKVSHVGVYDNSVWVASPNRGVFKLKMGKDINEITIVNQYFMGQDFPKVNYVEIGKKGQVYLGTMDGLYTLNTKFDKFEKIDSNDGILEHINVRTLYSNENEIWIGTYDGLYKYDKDLNSTVIYTHNPSDKSSISHWNITCIKENALGEIMVGTLGGLCTFDRENNIFHQINIFPFSSTDNHDIFIRSLFTDNLGNIWVGTEKTGLVHLYTYSKKFYALPNEKRFKPFHDNIINSIYSSNQVLWVGTAGSGLLKYDIKKDKIRQYKVDFGNPGAIDSDFITTILEDAQGEIWVGTWGLGIQKLAATNQNDFIKYRTGKGLPNEFISCIYACKNGLMVVGTQGGLCVFDQDQNIFIPIELTCGKGEDVWQVGCIQEDSDGFIWLGTTNGLFRFKTDLINPEEGIKLTKNDITVFKVSNQTGSIPDNYVTCVDIGDDGNIWIGTYGKGIAKCIPETNGKYSFGNYTEKDGLANNVIYEIVSDKNNELWISTENGLSKFNQKTNNFINYYSKDGLKNDQYYWSAASKASNGYIYFGGINGFNFFHPDSIKSYPYKPNTYITKLKVFNTVVEPGEKRQGLIPIKNSIFSSDTIQLSYKDNVFSLEFSGIPYYLASKIMYAYQLQGIDKDWVYVTADRRVASYTNLNGGEYIFQVKSTDPDGQWNDAITSALIIIKPPFWKTKWFRVLLVVFIFILISGYIRYRSFRISQQNKRLEKIVKIRTHEIKQKNKQLERNSRTLKANNKQLAWRQEEIEMQKSQLEIQNKEIICQRDQLITLNKEVESIHQMRMQFFTNISHEFRTPLTLIISPIEKILNADFNFSNTDMMNAVRYVKRNAERLLLLTNEITTFRKYEAGKVKVALTKGNVGGFIAEISDSFRQLAENKNIKFNVLIDFNLEDICYDKSKMENILFNLMSNAIKYTPEKGTISVSITKIKDEHNKPRLLVKIQDSGIGISKEYQDKIFERFFRETCMNGNNSYGTGIGLSLTKQMVEILNGSITFDSEQGRGSSFKVILPILESDFPEHEWNTGENTNQISLKERINLMSDETSNDEPGLYGNTNENKPNLLVVEDNSDLREFLAESLSTYYKVQTAADGQEGYRHALERDFDLVVSDVMMPKVSGLEMCKQLKNNIHTSHIPVILLTAKGQEEDFVEGLGHGADDFVTKPFNFSILQAKINSLIMNRKKVIKRFQQMDPDTEKTEISTSSLDENFMDRVNQLISDSYTDPTFDIEAFSSKMFVSRSLLYKKIKFLTNVAPNEYVNMYRLKKSIQLLKSKKHQISEVAFMVGFNDPKYFSRIFKKFYATSPSSYLD